MMMSGADMHSPRGAKPVAVFMCGKMGAGKSTTSERLTEELNAVSFSEDAWLAQLYPGEIRSFDDYLRCSAKLKPMIKATAQSVLARGVSVVMDFPANTRRQRAWLKSIGDECGVGLRLIYLEASDEVCLKRLQKRCIEQPERAAFDNEAVFRQVSQLFEPPSEEEGFHIEVITQ